MKLNRDKYLLARANACVSIKDLKEKESSEEPTAISKRSR